MLFLIGILSLLLCTIVFCSETASLADDGMERPLLTAANPSFWGRVIILFFCTLDILIHARSGTRHSLTFQKLEYQISTRVTWSICTVNIVHSASWFSADMSELYSSLSTCAMRIVKNGKKQIDSNKKKKKGTLFAPECACRSRKKEKTTHL